MKGLFIISALGILAMLAEIFKFKKLLHNCRCSYHCNSSVLFYSAAAHTYSSNYFTCFIPISIGLCLPFSFRRIRDPDTRSHVFRCACNY